MIAAIKNSTAAPRARRLGFFIVPSLFLFLPFVLSGCATMSFTASLDTRVAPLPGAQDRIPLRAALLVSPQDQAYVCHAPIPMGEWLYPFGQSLEQASEAALSQVFQSVTPVESPGDFSDYDVLIQPHFNQDQTSVKISMSSIDAAVGLGFDVSGPSGVIWHKDVAGRVTTGDTTSAMPQAGQALSQAVTQVAQAMAQDFSKPGFLDKIRGPGAAPGSGSSSGQSSGGQAPWWQQR